MTKNFTSYPAPDFSLIGDDDKRHRLADYQGSWTVLYFYPEDDTPGCTIEACSLRDSYHELLQNEVKVVGVSMDSPAKHQDFKAKYSLPFTLLSDPEREAIRAYNAWGKKMFGHEGILRKTFVIDPDGIVQKAYGRVTPLGHGAQLLKDIKALQLARE